jgi:hypothetical protein
MLKILKNPILKIIVLITSVLLSISISIPKNTTVLGGEYLFSFDYLGHLNNLVKNHIFDITEFKYQTVCRECPAFYHVSSWYMGWVIALLGIGQILGIHPFVFYLIVVINSQILALYYFVKNIFGKVALFPFAIAAWVFITHPHKIYLMPSATVDGLIYAVLIALATSLWTVRKKVYIGDFTNFWKLSVFSGVLFGFFLNIGIAHFPIALYMSLAIYLSAFFPLKRKNILHLLLSGSIMVLTAAVLNFPLIYSQILTGNAHSLTSFDILGRIDSLYSGMITAGADKTTYITLTFTALLLLLVSRFSVKNKLRILIIYILTAYILAGGKIGPYRIYGIVFDYAPFMEHMRGVYRFIFLEIGLLFIAIYSGLTNMHQRKKKLILVAASLILMSTTIQYVRLNGNLFQSAIIPADYREADNYLNRSPGKTIYLPAYWNNSSPSISGSYEWLNITPRGPSLYTNPFSSIFYAPGLLNFERANLTQSQSQLRYVVDHNNEPGKILQGLEYNGVTNLIIDKNYFWYKNFPKFDINYFSQNIQPATTFGKLEIYKLNDRSDDCKSAYGDFLLGYCLRSDPKILIDKKIQDYLLDQMSGNMKYYMKSNNKVPLPNFVVNTTAREEIIRSGILMPVSIYQGDNRASDIFTLNLNKGKYKLFVPILQFNKGLNIFGNESISVKQDGAVIRVIEPYGAYQGMVWNEIDLEVNKRSLVSLDLSGMGFIVLGNPLIINNDEWNAKFSGLSETKYESISKYGTSKPEVSINKSQIAGAQMYNGFINVDLLEKDKLLTGFTNNSYKVDEQITIVSSHSNSKLRYVLESTEILESGMLYLGTAFAGKNGLITIKTLNGKVLMEKSLSDFTEKINVVNFTDSVKSYPINGLAVELSPGISGALIYRLVLSAGFSDGDSR